MNILHSTTTWKYVLGWGADLLVGARPPDPSRTAPEGATVQYIILVAGAASRTQFSLGMIDNILCPYPVHKV